MKGRPLEILNPCTKPTLDGGLKQYSLLYNNFSTSKYLELIIDTDRTLLTIGALPELNISIYLYIQYMYTEYVCVCVFAI